MKKTQRIRSSTVKSVKIYRDKIYFVFKIGERKYKNNEGRLKISQEGYFSFLIKEEGKWKPKKGELVNLRLVKEVIGHIKAK